jgi:hypothetical protein
MSESRGEARRKKASATANCPRENVDVGTPGATLPGIHSQSYTPTCDHSDCGFVVSGMSARGVPYVQTRQRPR